MPCFKNKKHKSSSPYRNEDEKGSATFYDYSDTLPVASLTELGEIKEGVSFTITGYILVNCERFSINFIIENETRDVALHINPRLPQNYIVRNTKTKDEWGREYVSSPLPFTLHRGTKFAIQVLVTDACYMISVNGHHFAMYPHRLPYKNIATIEVRGDVDNVNIERAVVKEYPERLPESKAKNIPVLQTKPTEVSGNGAVRTGVDELDFHMPLEFAVITMNKSMKHRVDAVDKEGISLPYYGMFPANSLKTGRCLKIEGRVKLLPHSFYINLQKGQDIWPHPIIAFHFNPRFSNQSKVGKAIVCRNAWYDGQWAKEERSELDTKFCPGKVFRMVIACSDTAFEVYVNNELMTKFAYHLRPELVDTVYIQGDIKLWSIDLEATSSSPRLTRHVYNNPRYAEESD